MKNEKTKATKAIRDWLSGIGSTGGKAGTSSDKSKAALIRWNKPGARKSPATVNAGGDK